MLYCRWNPKKRLAPDEALRHAWILSAFGSNFNKSGNNELRHSHSEVNVAHDSSSHSSSSTSGGGSSVTHIRHNYLMVQKGEKSKAKILEARLHENTSKLDSNLNDSGTFLPPIL